MMYWFLRFCLLVVATSSCLWLCVYTERKSTSKSSTEQASTAQANTAQASTGQVDGSLQPESKPSDNPIKDLKRGQRVESNRLQPEAQWMAQERDNTPQSPFRGQGRMQRGGMGGGRMPFESPQSSRSDYPMWSIETRFRKDVFTFVRIQFDSFGNYAGRGQGWSNDYPDCDWNFSTRLQELTTFRVDPMGRVLRLSREEIFEYPFLFITNLGGMELDETERANLRRHLLNGGFMMADDFWAESSWRHIRQQMKQVFPQKEPRELTLQHPIFHIVYDLAKLPQVPSIRAWQRGLTYEDWHGPFENNDTSPHFWGYFDDDDRLMALFCHNNDIADGWEREGEDIEYFQEYSLKSSYPFGVNIITYAMSQ